jgi:hypothetical protein
LDHSESIWREAPLKFSSFSFSFKLDKMLTSTNPTQFQNLQNRASSNSTNSKSIILVVAVAEKEAKYSLQI